MYTVQVHAALAPLMEGIRCPHTQHLVAEIATTAIEMLAGDRYNITSGHHMVNRAKLAEIIADHLEGYSPAGAALNPGRLHED